MPSSSRRAGPPTPRRWVGPRCLQASTFGACSSATSRACAPNAASPAHQRLAEIALLLGVALGQQPPEHSTISRNRRRLDLSTHQQVFDWVLARLGEAGLVCGRTLGVDASTLEANAAVRSLQSRDTGRATRTFSATCGESAKP